MISKEEVQHIAKLARLGLTGKEIKKMQKELSSILDYFALLKEVEVSKTEPTFHSTQPFLQKGLGVMREDREQKRKPERKRKLMEMTPKEKDGFLKVKSIF